MPNNVPDFGLLSTRTKEVMMQTMLYCNMAEDFKNKVAKRTAPGICCWSPTQLLIERLLA